jgi:SAM-dependent methyltransferase
MRGWLTPRRRRGVEFLDEPGVADGDRLASMRDVERSNRLFGGTNTVAAAFARVLPRLPREAMLLDVGCGMGDVAVALRERAAHADVALTCIGTDISALLLQAASDRIAARVNANAMRLPFRDGSVDVVVCSQLLHHFEHDDAVRLVAELDRVARRAVIVADLRRSWLAVAGFWISALALRWHPITRHDGATSVLRGFIASELGELVQAATGRSALIRSSAFWRVTATWQK